MEKIPISNAPYQEMTFEFGGNKIRLTLRYNSVGQFWAMDIYEPLNERYLAQGVSLVCGVPLLWRTVSDYYFWVEDTSGQNLDPIYQQDLGDRCLLYIGEKP